LAVLVRNPDALGGDHFAKEPCSDQTSGIDSFRGLELVHLSQGRSFAKMPASFSQGRWLGVGMKVRYLVLIAVGLYATVVGCVMWSPGGTQTTGPEKHFRLTAVPPGLPYRGIVLQLQAINDLPAYEKAVDSIADTGADTIFLVTSARQENGTSSEIFMDYRMTPTPEKLGELIDYCKQRKMKVALMPVVLLDHPRNNEWRGKIDPAEHWNSWFDSYREMIDSFAATAALHDVDLFVVGSELVSSETQKDEWTKTIQSVRAIYKGNITYSANWDHYANIPFWDQLDLIGINCYYTLGKDRNVTVPEIDKNWEPIHQQLDDFVASKGKPLIFLEVGWCSVTNAADEPWDYTKDDLQVDDELQKRLYQAYFDTWYGDPHLGGFMIWEWPPGPPAPKGYTPQGKPAEAVLRAQFEKKPWKVGP
jgi:hypothetical protein